MSLCHCKLQNVTLTKFAWCGVIFVVRSLQQDDLASGTNSQPPSPRRCSLEFSLLSGQRIPTQCAAGQSIAWPKMIFQTGSSLVT